MGFFDFLMPDPPKPPKPKGYSISLEGTEGRLPVVYGRARISPITIFKYISGKDNNYLTLVDAYCEGRIAAIENVYLDNKDASDQDEFYGSGHGRPYIIRDERLIGSAESSGPTMLLDWPGGHLGDSPGWRASDRLQGVATSCLILRNHRNSPYSGEPTREAVIKGCCIWDPRDETQAYSASLSWQWSDNPALCLLDYLLNPVYGKGLPLERVNIESFSQMADFCDQPVTDAHGQRRKLLTCNISLDTEKQIMDNVNTLLKGMRGTLPEVDGQLTLVIERDTTPVMSLTEDDISAKDDISVEEVTKNDRYNRVTVKFKNPQADWQDDEVFWPPEGDLYQQWLAEDFGEALEKSMTVESCADHEEALQMAEVVCRRSRNNATVSLSAMPQALKLVQQDVIELTSAVRKWQSKPFRVEKIGIDSDLNVKLDLREHQNSIYPWTPKDAVSYPPSTGYTRARVPIPTDLRFSLVEGNPNKQGVIKWSVSSDEWIVQYRVLIERDGELVLNATPSAPELVLNTLDCGEYQVTISSLTSLGKESDAASLAFSIATPPIPAGCDISVDNFSVTLRPQLAYARSIGTEFEFYTTGSSEDGERVFLGRGTTFTQSSLLPLTRYFYQIRTINPWGQSEYLNVSAQTQKDPTPYLDLLDGSITHSQLAQELLKPIQRVDELESLDVAIESLNQAKDTINEQLGLLTDEIGTVNTQIGDVQTATDGNAQRISSVEASTEQMASRATQLEDVTASQAQSIEQLETTSGEQGSSIQQLLQTDSTKARRASWLQSQLEDAAAELLIQEEASGDETRRALALNVQQGDNAASVKSLQQVTADQAQMLEQLETSTTDQSSRISNVEQTTSNQAQTIQQLETQQGQQSAQIEQTAQTINDVNTGLSAMWKVSLGVTSDGKYYAAGFGAGIENTEHGLQSSFGVMADRFFVINPIKEVAPDFRT